MRLVRRADNEILAKFDLDGIGRGVAENAWVRYPEM
jgi:hypothetical protein